MGRNIIFTQAACDSTGEEGKQCQRREQERERECQRRASGKVILQEQSLDEQQEQGRRLPPGGLHHYG